MDSKIKGSIKLEKSWLHILRPEFEKNYMKELKIFLKEELNKGKNIFPKGREMFLALNSTPFEKVKAVILGQDPYHGESQAHGLCFSVQEGTRIPPSLKNIFLEMTENLKLPYPQTGCLLPWSRNGVLLLNTVLSVEKGLAGSHSGKGWERFTDAVITALNKKHSVVYMLWGNYAQSKSQLIDSSKNLILKAAHPSPLSSHRGFIGCKHFSKCNDYLAGNGIKAINWSL